jgi:hypothetical protein
MALAPVVVGGAPDARERCLQGTLSPHQVIALSPRGRVPTPGGHARGLPSTARMPCERGFSEPSP